MDASSFSAARMVGRTVSLRDLTDAMRASGDIDVFGKALADVQLRESAKAMGISISDADLQTRADAVRSSMGLNTPDETMAWLEQSGRTVDTFEAGLEAALLREAVIDRIADEARITSSFAQDKDGMAVVALAHIENEDLGAAEALLQRIKSGAISFAEAAEASLDLDTAPGGGYIGWRTRASLPPDFADHLFQLPIGDATGPIDVGGRAMLYQVLARKEATLNDATRARVKDAIFAEWLAGEIDRSGAKLNDDL